MRTLFFGSLVLLVTSGCASWFMNGGKLVDSGYQPSVRAAYTAPQCKMNDGQVVAGPAGTHYLVVQDGPDMGLFERSPDGSGAVITNRWESATAYHYFGWVQSSGWEYVFPKDPSVQPARVVYVGLQTAKDAQATRPTSAPSGACPLLPAQGSAG